MFRNRSEMPVDSSLEEAQVINIGGIGNKIKLVVAHSVAFLTIQQNGLYALEYKTDATDYRYSKNIVVADNSATYQETMSDSVHGVAWLQELNFELPRNTLELIEFIVKFNEVGFLAIVETRNQDLLLLGDPEQPLYIQSDMFTPGKRAGANKREWKFSAMVEHPAYLIV